MSDRWQRVGELFDRAIACPPDARRSVIDGSHEPDDVKDEVRSLLSAHDTAGDFLETPAAVDLVQGEMVGPYRIVRVLGRGGMGVVYEAEDTRLHRRVALKALPPLFASEERQRQRLRQEARAAAALQHPGIATVYALEEIDGQVFISSEYLEGETLREEISRRASGISGHGLVADALNLARALCAAHERGIVHRDLKPENIMRTRDGALKILDFGLAQFDDSARDLVSKSRVTDAGSLAGTPPYMAPEQLLGRETDFHTDHFAFAVLLYELCTGTHPFAATSLPATVARILATDVTRPTGNTIPDALWTIIERGLQKDPANRFPSSRDLVSAVEQLDRAPAYVASPHLARFARVDPLRWWRFHQFAAALAYWAMVWPAWHVHRSLGRGGLFFFFALLAAVVVAANLRLHLWFSSRVYPEDLPAQRADVGVWIRAADVAFAALLVMAGIALPPEQAGWAAVLISFGIGSALAFVFIEPATARAAFRDGTRLE